MININALKKEYNDFQLDVSCEINKGSIVGLLGRNGSGKTTIFKSILNLIKYKGDIEVFGHHLTTEDKEYIGVDLPDVTFDKEYTMKEMRRLLSYFYKNFDKLYFNQLVSRLDLPLDKKLKTFSTGMLAKAKIIFALSHHPHLLLLDEPTLGLDVIARDEILEILREYMEEDEERTILISSHISSDLETLCDEYLMIDNGHIALSIDSVQLNEDYGIIKTKEELSDLTHIQYYKKESYGYSYLTNNRSYYINDDVEPVSLDELMTLVMKGIPL